MTENLTLIFWFKKNDRRIKVLRIQNELMNCESVILNNEEFNLR